jgi:hypothetical protein
MASKRPVPGKPQLVTASVFFGFEDELSLALAHPFIAKNFEANRAHPAAIQGEGQKHPGRFRLRMVLPFAKHGSTGFSLSTESYAADLRTWL